MTLGCSNLKEEALDCIKWRNRFGRGCGPVIWQITDDDDDRIRRTVKLQVLTSASHDYKVQSLEGQSVYTPLSMDLSQYGPLPTWTSFSMDLSQYEHLSKWTCLNIDLFHFRHLWTRLGVDLPQHWPPSAKTSLIINLPQYGRPFVWTCLSMKLSQYKPPLCEILSVWTFLSIYLP